MVVEIGRQRLRRRRIDRSGLGGVELDEFYGALFVLKPCQRVHQHFRRFEAGRDRPCYLTPQRHPPLFGDVTLFAVADLPGHGLEARRVERAIDALEIGIVEDHAHGFVIGLPEAEPPRLLIKGGFRNGLLEHLAIKPEGAGLIHGQGAAELAADLLQPLGVDLAELLGRDFGMAHLGQRRLSETPEDVGDAPDAEADDQDAHHRGHNDFAEPV